MPDKTPNDIEGLEQKIRTAKGEEEPIKEEEESGKRGMRAGSEFLAAVCGFGVMGFFVDSYLGTKPWGMISLFILGFVAGVYTANKTMNKTM